MALALTIISLGISLMVLGLAVKLLIQDTLKGVEKSSILIFLALFSLQTLLLIFQLMSWLDVLVSIRPFMAAVLAPCCFWALTVVVRDRVKLRLMDLVHLMPVILNAFEFIAFDYSLIAIQICYSVLMFHLVFDPRLNKRGALKLTVLLFALIFTVISLFDLLIAFEVNQQGQLEESIFLFFALFILYSLLLVIVTIASANPGALHLLLSDIQFYAINTLPRDQTTEYDVILSRFHEVEEAIKSNQYYLQDGFNLSYLAECLQLTPRELSNIINRGAKKHFSAYINDLKIAQAKTMLRSPEHENMNVTQIMYESGFVTKSSFNREFSLRTNMTPSQYREAGKS